MDELPSLILLLLIRFKKFIDLGQLKNEPKMQKASKFDLKSLILLHQSLKEFIRLQETVYPSEVHDDKAIPLSTNQSLGHHIAFAYDIKRQVLALQYDLRALALSRINHYIAEYPPFNMYLFTPLYRNDTWKSIESSLPKKIKIAVAYPSGLPQVAGPHKALYENISNLGTTFGTHILEVSMSMGQTDGVLRDSVGFLKNIARRGDSGEIDLRKLRAKPEDQTDEINLIDQILNEEITLDLSKNDPTKSYAMRIGAVKAGLQRNADKF